MKEAAPASKRAFIVIIRDSLELRSEDGQIRLLHKIRVVCIIPVQRKSKL